ncbi:camp-dependent protein kinase catalytic subunit [Nowakowskiella sp. JEL0078]|nr:camp-dependent protein kinase catalytic subunit [Nowakowskiella sp. JEL0078]
MSLLRKLKETATGKSSKNVVSPGQTTPKSISEHSTLSKESSVASIKVLNEEHPISNSINAERVTTTCKEEISPMELDSPIQHQILNKELPSQRQIQTQPSSQEFIQIHQIPPLSQQSSQLSVTTQQQPLNNHVPVARPKQKYSLNDFNINRTLGTGSFGRVHSVQLKSNGKYYAMKVLKKSEIVKMRQVEHTVNERAILEQLEFPYMVHLLATFQDCSNLYFVLEYVQGGELFSYLRRCGRFPNHVAKFYAAEVVLAFEYLHSKDIIYRDLKPENLLIDAEGHIKITDFGFAKLVPDVTWTLCGTPDYLAPEIIQSKGYGRAVDWWALGILIYEMLAGHPPFYEEDHFKLYEKILLCKPKFPANFDPAAKDLVKRLLTADLTKRYGNLRGGVNDIKRHKWFTGINWEKIRNVQVPAPYIPPIKGDGDTSNFDPYPEDYEPYGAVCPDPHRDKFKDF